MNKSTFKLTLSTAIILLATSWAQADETDTINLLTPNLLMPQKSFTYVGGTLSYNDRNSTQKGNFGLGVDTLYLRKVWGGFSLGINANFTFGLPTSAGIIINTPTKDFTGKSTNSLHSYNVSLVLGGISEHKDGGRLAYFIGPMIGGSTVNYKTTWDEQSALDGITNYKGSENSTKAGLTAGIYYKLPNSGWTAGVNANVYIGSRYYSEFDAGTTVSLSLGYSF